MSNFARMVRQTNSQIDEALEEKRKQRELENSWKERKLQMLENEKKYDREKARQDDIYLRGLAAEKSLARQNDAFEVSAGRQDPAYFNLKYGSGAPAMSTTKRTTAKAGDSTTKQPDYAKMLIEAYKASDAGIGKSKEDFLSFADRTLPQLQKDFPTTAKSIDPWEIRRKKNAMDYGSRVTKDFQDDMTMSRTPEGALRFSGNGVRSGDINLGQGWNDEAKNRIKNFDNSLPIKKPLYKKSLRDYKVTPKGENLLMEDFEDPFYKEKPAWLKKRQEEKRKQRLLQNKEYLNNR